MAGEAPSARVERLLGERARLRALRSYAEADRLRRAIEAEGYLVRDTPAGSTLERVVVPQQPDAVDRRLAFAISVHLLAEEWLDDVRRCIASVEANRSGHAIELVVVDNASAPDSRAWLDGWASGRWEVQVIRLQERLGYAAARNAGLRCARGDVLLLLDSSVELTGDLFTPLLSALTRDGVGATGAWGVRTRDLRHFHESEEAEVDALLGYCFAFRRDRLAEVGLLDEKFKFYRNADLDYSFAFRAHGYRLWCVRNLPLLRHEHRAWGSLPEVERERLSKRNFYRFLDKWRDRTDLLVTVRTGASDR